MKYLSILPLLASLTFTSVAPAAAAEKMDLQKLKAIAFARCQGKFTMPKPEPVPVLDPPQQAGADTVGMVYQEELAVRTSNLMDRDGFYMSPRPRAAVNTLPVDIYVDNDNSGNYVKKTWADANPDYSSPQIVPAIDKSQIPAAGRVLTELIIGHLSPQGDYPQLFDIRSSAYVRFAGYPSQITGASLRLAGHKIFSQGGPNETNAQEDFPIVRSMYMSVKGPDVAQALLLVESDLFCGALQMDMTAAVNADIVVDSHWYTRRDFIWKKDPHTALVAYSSMLFQTEKDTPGYDSDEAHDSDMLRIEYSNGQKASYGLQVPKIHNDLKIQEFSEPASWILANEDRDPSHYAHFAPALGNTNYNYRASYRVDILATNIRMGLTLYQHSADGEYGDNLVAASTIRQDFRKARNVNESVHFKYRTTAFLPGEK